MSFKTSKLVPVNWLDIGVISPALFVMMVLMALFTTFMTSPLLEAIYPARRIGVETGSPSPSGWS